MSSQLDVYNGALRLIGQRKLSALTDATEARYLLDDAWTYSPTSMLESGDWNFGSLSVAIENSLSVTPAFGYANSFQKPTDWLRTIAVSANGMYFPALGAGEWIDEGGYWNANCNPLYVRYVSSLTTAGMNVGSWPAVFALAVEYDLAWRIAPHLTSKNSADMEQLRKDARRALVNARSKEATNSAPGLLAPSRLARARAGYLSRIRWPSER